MENNQEELKNLTIVREFATNRDRVWQAWTDPKELAKWWGPRGVTNPKCIWEAREGGNIDIVMFAGSELGPYAGAEWPMTGTMKEVVPKERLVFAGNAIMDGKIVLEDLCTVTFEDLGDKTKMTLTVVVTMTTPEGEGPLQGMKAGWTQSIDKLGELLAV